jgi:deoxycytidylate deaminase
VPNLATANNIVPVSSLTSSTKRDSREIVLENASNEFVFAVVGHAGSGTSKVADTLARLLLERKFGNEPFEVVTLKARDVIKEWARNNGKLIPTETGVKLLSDVKKLQDYGDEMRAEKTKSGEEDHAAIARGFILRIRQQRAAKLGQSCEGYEEIAPDGKPRAYILDCLRHPAEANMLRRVYEDSFVLIGVVCEEEKRIGRISQKFSDGGRQAAIEFMKRDADAIEKYGQHVAAAFHLSDYFIDNTDDQFLKNKAPNPDWDVVEKLSRLVKIVTHSELVRPAIAETAMHHARSAQMRSACLSRQVGAAIVDKQGNVVSTGTNEVPKAGGGVYGESFDAEVEEARCALFADPTKRFCSNTTEQNEIIEELINATPELRATTSERKEKLRIELRNTQIGALVEFSRAVHAEMDALLSAARNGVSSVGTRLFVTTFPCHYCARHIVTSGVDEVQFIEPYPKSRALRLHPDSIQTEHTGWNPPSAGGSKVLFRPFSGVAPRLYKRAFLKDRELKDKISGRMEIQEPEWGTPWYLPRRSYVQVEAELAREESNNGG